MSKSVVLLPSVQPNRGLDGYVEGEGMRIVAEISHDMLLDAPGYEAELFWPGYEEGAGFPMLRRQQKQAEMWLRAQPGLYSEKIALNLHSDSGAQSHVSGIYGVAPDGKRRGSYHLAAAVAPAVARAMKIRKVRIVTRLGATDYSRHIFYREQFFTSALVECGAHGNARDVRYLSDTPEVVARAIVVGIQAYFTALQPKPGVVWRGGQFHVTVAGAISRSAPSRTGRALRGLGPAVFVTDGYTEGGQRVAGSTRWYHLARESGYGWVHSSAGRYTERKEAS